MLSIAIEDDDMLPPATVHKMAAWHPAATIEYRLLRPADHGLPRIGHIQLADTPGRHEPGTGEINFPFLFAHLDALGYAGWVGCEYVPATTTEAGLGWRPGR